MGYLTEPQMIEMGFRSLGKGVKISNKAAIYDADQIELGDYSRIDDFSTLSGRVRLGRNVMVSALCHIGGGSPGVILNDFVTLAYGVKVMSQSDDYLGDTMTNPTIPADFKNEVKERTTIGRHVIIGTNSVVLPGANIGEGCAIGAMSLVLRSTEPWGVYAGSPVRRLKERSRKLLDLESEFLSATTSNG